MPPAKAAPPAKRAPKKFRVLFYDPTGAGRFEDVEASSEAHAAWIVAIGMDQATFIGIIPVPAADA